MSGTALAGHAPALVMLAPPRCAAERSWVCAVLFERWLGLPLLIQPHSGPDVVLQLRQGDRLLGEVVWADAFFAQVEARWLQPDPGPALPLPQWRVADAELAQRIDAAALPQPFGDGRFERTASRIRLPIDITGSAFYMLSRYEEALPGAAADRHGRFPGRASLAHRSGLALRPWVDEWLELLWWALQQLVPGLQRRPRQASTWVSCDVDAPYSAAGAGIVPVLRQTASHLLNDRRPRLAAQALLHAAASACGVQRFDAFDTFDWMLDVNQGAGNRVAFFFLALQQPAPIDCHYTLAQPRMAALLRRIVNHGHEVGLHGSYGSVDDAAAQARELATLRTAVAMAGGEAHAVVGARQHYLRWRPGHSAAQLAALGLGYDSTLGYPDAAGFRCGTCHAYPMFDLVARQALTLLQRPLVLMEVTVTSPVYMGLGHGDEAAALMLGLRARCHRFGGEFSLLWHNSNLAFPQARALYRTLIAA